MLELIPASAIIAIVVIAIIVIFLSVGYVKAQGDLFPVFADQKPGQGPRTQDQQRQEQKDWPRRAGHDYSSGTVR